MSARMWKVREALMQPATDKADYDRRVAALAEVEEWEAEVQRLGDDVAEQALRIIDLGQKENEAVARAEAAEAELARVSKEYADWKEAWNRREVACEAAEAEADRLQAALTEIAAPPEGRWLDGKQAKAIARAALAPADRNTEEGT